jgi:hypothetical protein
VSATQRAPLLVAILSVVLTSCSRFADVAITNPCPIGLEVAFWGSAAPPDEPTVDGLSRRDVAANATTVVVNAFEAPDGFRGGIVFVWGAGSAAPTSITVGPTSADPVPVNVPTSVC